MTTVRTPDELGCEASMTSPYHAGELAVQARAEMLTFVRRVGRILQRATPDAARALVAREQFAVVAAVGAGGGITPADAPHLTAVLPV